MRFLFSPYRFLVLPERFSVTVIVLMYHKSYLSLESTSDSNLLFCSCFSFLVSDRWLGVENVIPISFKVTSTSFVDHLRSLIIPSSFSLLIASHQHST